MLDDAGRAHLPGQRDRAGRRVRLAGRADRGHRRPAPGAVAGGRPAGRPGHGGELTGAQRAQLDRIVRTGVACGVHLIVRGLDLLAHPTVARLAVRERTATCDLTGDLADPPRPAAAGRSGRGVLPGGGRAAARRSAAGPARRPGAGEALDGVVRARPDRADRRQHRRRRWSRCRSATTRRTR